MAHGAKGWIQSMYDGMCSSILYFQMEQSDCSSFTFYKKPGISLRSGFLPSSACNMTFLSFQSQTSLRFLITPSYFFNANCISLTLSHLKIFFHCSCFLPIVPAFVLPCVFFILYFFTALIFEGIVEFFFFLCNKRQLKRKKKLFSFASYCAREWFATLKPSIYVLTVHSLIVTAWLLTRYV